MPAASNVYAHALADEDYGYPLWDPGYEQKAGEVEIGDVGFIEKGRFVRLFNVMQRPDDELNALRGVPEGFRQLTIDEKHISTSSINRDSFWSKHITKVEAKATAGAGSTFDASLTYKATSSSGAILHLPTGYAEERQVSERSMIMHEYLRRNYEHWHRYIQQSQKFTVAENDLLFVRGWVKTADWIVAAFAHSKEEEGASIGGGHGLFKASFSIDLAKQEVQGGWTNRCARTKQEAHQVDQCIFIHFLKHTAHDRWNGC
ncbi:hypothetical protein DAEQUDRAFT_530972 [Daedalea quercina L-15889]|uniref:Uncharacterized protein n=1 Tax=Daedalea quercina L-15889 TaxID=1314783 RepID=A0A165M8M3_9APHY|nr:hypothetical protein DAEQUDRAFT_530972 [Daedalea quercina L-15889]